MASTTAQEGLTHRAGARADGDATAAARADGGGSRGGNAKTKQQVGGGGRAKRGVRSLAAAVSLAAGLTALSFFLASGGAPRAAATTVAMVRAGSVAGEAVMAVAAWLAWAEGGLHARPGATAAPFAAQLGAALAWAPLVLGHGAARAGMACCAAMACAAAACARGFGAVNPVAGDLAKPGVAWALLLAVFNYKML
ncbi:hypothetical protein ACP4OV_029201 [Aristida adscensionis]